MVEIESRGEQTFVSNTFFGNKKGSSERHPPVDRPYFGDSSWLGYIGDQGNATTGSSDSFLSLTTGKTFRKRKAPFTNFGGREPNNLAEPGDPLPDHAQNCLTSDLVYSNGQWDDIECVPARNGSDHVELYYAGVVCEKGEAMSKEDSLVAFHISSKTKNVIFKRTCKNSCGKG